MIMMIKVIIVMMTGEHNAGDDCDEAKQKNEQCVFRVTNRP